MDAASWLQEATFQQGGAHTKRLDTHVTQRNDIANNPVDPPIPDSIECCEGKDSVGEEIVTSPPTHTHRKSQTTPKRP